MLVVKEYIIGNVPREHIIGEAATIEAALDIVPGEVFLYEEDAEHPGHYDVAAIAEDMVRVYTITPSQ